VRKSNTYIRRLLIKKLVETDPFKNAIVILNPIFKFSKTKKETEKYPLKSFKVRTYKIRLQIKNI